MARRMSAMSDEDLRQVERLIKKQSDEDLRQVERLIKKHKPSDGFLIELLFVLFLAGCFKGCGY